MRQQIKDVGGYRQWTGDYICLRFIAKPTAEGGRIRVRPQLTVSDAMRAGARIPGYQLAHVPNQVFPTKVAAVEAGCAAAKAMIEIFSLSSGFQGFFFRDASPASIGGAAFFSRSPATSSTGRR